MNGQMLFGVLCCVFGYLLGSFPTGLIVARKVAGRDVRQEGSGNIGATNVRRVAGTIPAVVTLAGDMAKGAVPVLIARGILTGEGVEIFIAATALSAFLGHLYPIWLGFDEGGKGVATAGGCFLVLSPAAFGIAFIVFAGMIRLSRKVSVSSLSAVVVLAFTTWLSAGFFPYGLLSAAVALLVILRHRGNIRRLLAGTEPDIGGR